MVCPFCEEAKGSSCKAENDYHELEEERYEDVDYDEESHSSAEEWEKEGSAEAEDGEQELSEAETWEIEGPDSEDF